MNSPVSFLTNLRQDSLQRSEMFSWNKIINTLKRSRGILTLLQLFKPSGWKCYKTFGSYVRCAFIEIWSTREVWRALKKLELLLRIFPALQTFRVLHISMNARWRMNHLLIGQNFLTFNPKGLGFRCFKDVFRVA